MPTPRPFVPVEVAVTLDELLMQLLNLFLLLLLLLIGAFLFITHRERKRKDAEEKRQNIEHKVKRELVK